MGPHKHSRDISKNSGEKQVSSIVETIETESGLNLTQGVSIPTWKFSSNASLDAIKDEDGTMWVISKFYFKC